VTGDGSAARDLLVRTANPKALDDTIQALPGCAAAVVDGSWDGDVCRVPGCSAAWTSCASQSPSRGYGEIVGEEPVG